MKAAWHIASKDLLLLLRDRVALFWVLGFPVLFALFLGAVLQASLSGNGAPLRVQVVVDESDAALDRLLSDLGSSARLDLQRARKAEALEAVRRGQAVAAIFITGSATVLRDAALQSRQAMPSASVVVDPAREMEAAIVQAELLRVLMSGPDEGDPADLVTTEHLQVHAAPRRASDYVFAPAILWGLIGCAACFAISLVSERTRGTLKRLATAPVRRGTILLGKAMACGIACLSVGFVLVLLAWLIFDVSFEYPGKLFLALISSSICFAGITMLLSVLGRTEQSVAGAGWASLIVLSMFGGGMVPLSLMPSWMAEAGQLSPVRWGIVALEGALWRGFSYYELGQACGVLLLTGGVAFVVGSVSFRRSFD